MRGLLILWLFLAHGTVATAGMDLELLQLHRDYTEALSIENEVEAKASIIRIRQAYQRLLASTEHPSAALHYNLGTLHLKLEEYGPAIYHLKMAHLKDPNDHRFVDHLQRASTQAGVPIVKKDQTLVEGWLHDTWAALSVKMLQIALIFFAVLLMFLIVKAPQKRKSAQWRTMTLVLMTVTSLIFVRQSGWGLSCEVVLIEEINPRSGVGLAYPGILAEGKLKGGHSGVLLRQQGDWMEVSWYESGKGWVPADKVSKVSSL